MSFEFWKVIFDWSAVVLLGLTFIAGLGALVTGKVVDLEGMPKNSRLIWMQLIGAHRMKAQSVSRSKIESWIFSVRDG